MLPSKKAKNFLTVFVTSLLLSSAVIISVNYIYDPWQIFHKPWLREVFFIGHARFQNVGLINNYDFDSAFIGGSTAINFSAKEASQLFKADFVNLAIRGGVKTEHDLVLKYLFQKKTSIKNIFYVINFTPEEAFDQKHSRIDFESFSFLYDDDRFNDLKLYLNPDLLLCIGRSNCRSLPGDRSDNLYAVYKNHFVYLGVKQWIKNREKLQVANTLLNILKGAMNQRNSMLYQTENPFNTLYSKSTLVADKKSLDGTSLKQQFEYYLLNYVRKHSNTNFYLSFIPRSRIFYSKLFWDKNFDLFQEWQKYIVMEAEKYNNLHVFGFGNESFLENLDKYRDGSHFSSEINSLMLKRMSTGRNELTSRNIDKYLLNTRRKAASYELLVLAEQICTLLKQQPVLKKEWYNWKQLCYNATNKSF